MSLAELLQALRDLSVSIQPDQRPGMSPPIDLTALVPTTVFQSNPTNGRECRPPSDRRSAPPWACFNPTRPTAGNVAQVFDRQRRRRAVSIQPDQRPGMSRRSCCRRCPRGRRFNPTRPTAGNVARGSSARPAPSACFNPTRPTAGNVAVSSAPSRLAQSRFNPTRPTAGNVARRGRGPRPAQPVSIQPDQRPGMSRVEHRSAVQHRPVSIQPDQRPGMSPGGSLIMMLAP